MDELLTLYHGSKTIIEKPIFGYGNPRNDYGLGFYCTQQKDLACEWACPSMQDGICNEYRVNLSGLKILDLRSSDFSLLNWLAILVDNRTFESTDQLMKASKLWLLENHLPSLEGIDVAIGLRADDSYYSFARSFLEGRLSYEDLGRAMELGNLGHQVVLLSKPAFDALRFVRSESVPAEIWCRKRQQRDQDARRAYRKMVESRGWNKDARYVIDLMRGEL